MDASKSLSCENNNSSLFSAVPDSSIMYQNKDSNLINDKFHFPWIHFKSLLVYFVYSAIVAAINFTVYYFNYLCYFYTFIHWIYT